jgi:TolB-like protein/Tfp pilus assembly protein PilF
LSLPPGSNLPRLEVFGGFRLAAADGRGIAISSRKNRALLAMLALSPGQAASRDQALALLWGDRGEQQARNSLRQALVALRRDLAPLLPPPLVLHDDVVRLDQGCLAIDAVEFQRFLESGDWNKAASTYKGPLLAGLNLADGAFEDWLREQRDIASGKAMRALEQLASQQQGEARVATCKQLLAFDAMREASHRALMSAYAAAGEPALALRQYEACRELLKSELGVAPAQQTEDLRTGIATGRLAEAPAPLRAAAKPSIAVMPFANPSHDPEQDHLGDGIVNDIISALSRFHALTVIGRSSSFAFRNSPLGMAEIGRRLSVAYLLIGSLQTSRRRLRLSVELIEVQTATVVRAQNYDRNLDDVFEIQDELARLIASNLTGRVEIDVASRAARKHPSAVAAYDLALRGLQHQQRVTRKDTLLAIDHLERAVALDPGYADAHSWLAFCHHAMWQFDYSFASLERASEVAHHAVDFDPFSARCHLVLGFCWLYRADRAKSEYHHRRALALNPNDPHVLAHAALLEIYMGQPTEAARYFADAFRLNPFPPLWYREFRCAGDVIAGRYDEARAGFEIAPDTYWDRLYLLSSYGHLGCVAEAAALRSWFRERLPHLDLIAAARTEPFWRDEDRERLVDGIKLAMGVDNSATVVRLERRK